MPSHRGLQHTRHLCSSLSLGVCSDSQMLGRWHRFTMDCTLDSLSAGVCSDAQTLRPCHQLIFCRPTLLLLSVFPSVRVFSNELTLRIWCLKFRTSASASIPPVNIQGWFHLGLTDLISWQTKGLSRVFFSTTIRKHQFFSSQLFLMVQFSHQNMTTVATPFLHGAPASSLSHQGHFFSFLTLEMSSLVKSQTEKFSFGIETESL